MVERRFDFPPYIWAAIHEGRRPYIDVADWLLKDMGINTSRGFYSISVKQALKQLEENKGITMAPQLMSKLMLTVPEMLKRDPKYSKFLKDDSDRFRPEFKIEKTFTSGGGAKYHYQGLDREDVKRALSSLRRSITYKLKDLPILEPKAAFPF